MIARFLSWLLWLANARMGRLLVAADRDRAYAIKDRLLRRYGTLVGEDIQHVTRECYTCEGSGEYSPGVRCRRCDGTGIWSERWFRLERWQLGGRIFHRPAGAMAQPMNGMVTIEGRIYHSETPARAAAEAFLWLALAFDRRLFLRELTHGGRFCGWQWRPMLALQVVAFEVRMFVDRFRPRRCSCGRRFLIGFAGAGWLVCRHCRPKPIAPRRTPSGFRQVAFTVADADDDLPF